VGTFVDGKGEFYREWETPNGIRVGRITFSRVSADVVSWSLAVSSDGRRNWTTMWTMDMRRSGK
jgi:hypothetical protein